VPPGLVGLAACWEAAHKTLIFRALYQLQRSRTPRLERIDTSDGEQEGQFMDTKKLVAGVALAGTIVVGTAGVAFAADSPTTGSGAAQAQGHPGLRREARKGAAEIVRQATNTQPGELRTYLKNGGTVAGFITDHGATVDAVSTSLVNAATTKINAAVASGKITQDKATKIEDKLPGLVTKLMNRTWGQHAQA